MKNKGFTLIESIVAFAVLGIASLAIGGFFITSSRSYSGAKNETALQYEAQLSLNQIEAMIIDSTLGVNYNLISDEGAPETYQFVENDGKYEGNLSDVTSKVLYVFSADRDRAGLRVALLKWNSSDKCLYYKDLGTTLEDNNVTNVSAINISQITGWDLFAEGIKDFSIDLSKYEKTRMVDIGLHVIKANKKYETIGTITLRNNVLINEDEIKEIYENIESITDAEITGVSLAAKPNVTVPGGSVQMIPRVYGTGYPSQEIHRWWVATASDMNESSLIFDSAIDGNENTYIDMDTLVLHVAEDLSEALDEGTFHEILYVRAMVDTGEKDENGKTKYIYNETACPVWIKDIDRLDVTPSADLDLAANEMLKEDASANKWKTASWTKKAGQTHIPEMNVYPGNNIKMDAKVTGSNSLTDDEKTIVWSIINPEGKATATIRSTGRTTGLLEIGSMSQPGTFIVRAALKLDRNNIYVDYTVNVRSQFANGVLEVIPNKNIVNRGGTVECTVKLNGTTIPQTDCDWSVSVAIADSPSQGIMGKPVTVNGNGTISAGYGLSFDDRFIIVVKATLKSDADVYDTALVNVPEVEMLLTPPEYRSMIGATIPVDKIICTVTGLEEYDIKWTMARATNPTIYFEKSGQSEIEGHYTANGHTPEVKIAANEHPNLQYMRVKATLAGYSDHFKTMKVNLQELDYRIDVEDGLVVRGGKEDLRVTLIGNAEGVELKDTDVEWSIVNAIVQSSDGLRPTTIKGLTIDQEGVLSVDKEYESNVTASIEVTVQANWNGIIRTETVTVLSPRTGVFYGQYTNNWAWDTSGDAFEKKTFNFYSAGYLDLGFNCMRDDRVFPEGTTILWQILDDQGNVLAWADTDGNMESSGGVEIRGTGTFTDGEYNSIYAIKVRFSYTTAGENPKVGKTYYVRANRSDMNWHDDLEVVLRASIE